MMLLNRIIGLLVVRLFCKNRSLASKLSCIVLSDRVTPYCGGISSKVSQINCMQAATLSCDGGTKNTSLIRSTKRPGLIARLALTYSIHFHSGSHRQLSAKRMRSILYISHTSRSATDKRSLLRIKAQRTAAVCGNIQSDVAHLLDVLPSLRYARGS